MLTNSPPDLLRGCSSPATLRLETNHGRQIVNQQKAGGLVSNDAKPAATADERWHSVILVVCKGHYFCLLWTQKAVRIKNVFGRKVRRESDWKTNSFKVSQGDMRP